MPGEGCGPGLIFSPGPYRPIQPMNRRAPLPLGRMNPDVHSRFRILLSIIRMTAIFSMAAIFASLAILSAASPRKNATGREQGDNA